MTPFPLWCGHHNWRLLTLMFKGKREIAGAGGIISTRRETSSTPTQAILLPIILPSTTGLDSYLTVAVYGTFPIVLWWIWIRFERYDSFGKFHRFGQDPYSPLWQKPSTSDKWDILKNPIQLAKLHWLGNQLFSSPISHITTNKCVNVSRSDRQHIQPTKKLVNHDGERGAPFSVWPWPT